MCLLHTFLVVLHVVSTSYISCSSTCCAYFIHFRQFYMLCLLHTFSVMLRVGILHSSQSHYMFFLHYIFSLSRYTFYLLRALSVSFIFRQYSAPWLAYYNNVGRQCKFWSFSLCHFSVSVTSALLFPNILHNSFFSNALFPWYTERLFTPIENSS